MARYDKLVTLDGEAIRARRKSTGFSLKDVAAEEGSASVSVWRLAEAGEQISERSASKILRTLSRLEIATQPTGEMVLVPKDWLDRVEDKLEQLLGRLGESDARSDEAGPPS